MEYYIGRLTNQNHRLTIYVLRVLSKKTIEEGSGLWLPTSFERIYESEPIDDRDIKTTTMPSARLTGARSLVRNIFKYVPRWSKQ